METASARPLQTSPGRATPTMTATESFPIPVAVFAHNEENHIIRCLESLSLAADGSPLSAYVLANGCTDRTEEIVRGYAQTHPGVSLISIAVGDKANAWNV